MNQDFNAEEMKNIIRMARVHCPGFTEDMLESLMELQKHLADSGYLEVIQGILRLEEEKGVKFTEALNACEDLMAQREKLENQIPELETKRENVKEQIRKASNEYDEYKKATEAIRQDLAQIQNEYAAAERRLVNFNKKLEKEKQHIEKEIEQRCQEAEVTKEEVMAAGQLKKEASEKGLSIEFILDVAGEFAGYENSVKDLSEGLKKHSSLTKYLDDLSDWSKKKIESVTAEIASLELQKKGLTEESNHMTGFLSQLQADIKGEEKLRRFYYRYVGISGLMEHLASWSQIFFIRCTNPVFIVTGAFNASSGNAHFWTDKLPLMCPRCGHRNLVYDETVYQSLGWPVGQPVKLNLGEYNG